MSVTTHEAEHGIAKTLSLPELTREALLRIRSAEDKDLTLVLGVTGVGKSTLINYLMGSRLIKVPLDPTDEYSPLVVKISEGSKEYAIIGQNRQSETLYSQYIGPALGNIYYCDCPGFEDNRKGDEKICASLSINLAVRVAKNISSIIVVIDWNTIKDKTGNFLKLVKNLSEILRDPITLLTNSNPNIPSPILFVITKIPNSTDDGRPFQLGHIITALKEWQRYYSDIINRNIIELKSLLAIADNELDLREYIGRPGGKIIDFIMGKVSLPQAATDIVRAKFLEHIMKKLEELGPKLPAEQVSKAQLLLSHISANQRELALVNIMLSDHINQGLLQLNLDDGGRSRDTIIRHLLTRKGQGQYISKDNFYLGEHSTLLNEFRLNMIPYISAGDKSIQIALEKLQGIRVLDRQIVEKGNEIARFKAVVSSGREEKSVMLEAIEKSIKAHEAEQKRLQSELSELEGSLREKRRERGSLDSSEPMSYWSDSVHEKRNTISLNWTKYNFHYSGPRYAYVEAICKRHGAIIDPEIDPHMYSRRFRNVQVSDGEYSATYESRVGEDGEASVEIFVEKRHIPGNAARIKGLDEEIRTLVITTIPEKNAAIGQESEKIKELQQDKTAIISGNFKVIRGLEEKLTSMVAEFKEMEQRRRNAHVILTNIVGDNIISNINIYQMLLVLRKYITFESGDFCNFFKKLEALDAISISREFATEESFRQLREKWSISKEFWMRVVVREDYNHSQIENHPLPQISGENIQEYLELIRTSEIDAVQRFCSKSSNSSYINWLHILHGIKFPAETIKKMLSLIQDTVRRVMQLGLSPYERTSDGYTAFNYLGLEDNNQLFALFRHGSSLAPDFIGVEKQIKMVSDFLAAVAKDPKTNNHFLLLSGPPGVGKTELVRELITQKGYHLNEFARGTQEDKWVGQLEARITEFFNVAKSSGKLECLFLDEIDAICPEYQGAPSASSHNPDQIVTLIQMELDKLKGTNVVLIGATNYLTKVKPAITNRALPIIQFNLPSKLERKKILEDALRFERLLDGDLTITKIAEATVGWSPRLLKQYTTNVIKKAEDEKCIITQKYFEEAFEFMRSSLQAEFAKKEIQVEPPKLKWDSVFNYDNLVGLDSAVKESLNSACLLLDSPDRYVRAGVSDLNILLYGPPGTGKTSFARTVANNTNALCIYVDANSYRSYGAPEKLKEIFAIAKRHEKAIIFIDEIDVITQRDSLVKATLQTEMDGVVQLKDNVLVVIGATNHPEQIADPVLSRFRYKINVPLPNVEQRYEVFYYYLSWRINSKQFKIGKDLNNLCLASLELATVSDGLAQRDIKTAIDNVIIKVLNSSATGEELCLTCQSITEEVIAMRHKQAEPVGGDPITFQRSMLDRRQTKFLTTRISEQPSTGEEQLVEGVVELSKKTDEVEKRLRMMQRPVKGVPDGRLMESCAKTAEEAAKIEQEIRGSMKHVATKK